MAKLKNTPEQRAARKLDTSIEPSAFEKRQYEIQTYRSGRKNRTSNYPKKRSL